MVADKNSSQDVKNIVVLGANGGIGQDVVRRLAEAVNDGKPYHVTIVSRKSDKFGQAQLMELMESFGNDSKGDLLAHLKVGPQFDAKNLNTLEPVLKNADMVVCAAGLPRPNPPPPRSALIYPNAPLVKNISEAVAKYAPANTPLLLGTNPLDNTVQIADETIKKVWKNERKGETPAEVKVFGMAGNLDESRLRVYAAQVLNQALVKECKGASSYLESKQTGKQYVRPQDIGGKIYGQHGPKMVVDLKSVTVRGKPLEEFISENGIANTEVKISSSRNGEKILPVKKAIEEETVDGGAKIIVGLGRSTQIGAAGQIFRMVEDYFAKDKKEINACVVSGFMNDERKIAYGRPVVLGQGAIELTKDFAVEKDLQSKIKASRDEIHSDHDHYRNLGKIEEGIFNVLKHKTTHMLTPDKELVITAKEKGFSLPRNFVDGIARIVRTDTVEDIRISKVEKDGEAPSWSIAVPKGREAYIEALSDGLDRQARNQQHQRYR